MFDGSPIKTHRCGCDEILSCAGAYDASLPLPAGWKIARCPCGNVMNLGGDIYVNAPSVLCPEHSVPAIVKCWVCALCGRNASEVAVSDASGLTAVWWGEMM